MSLCEWRCPVACCRVSVVEAASVSVTSRFAWLGNAVGIVTGNGQTSVNLVGMPRARYVLIQFFLHGTSYTRPYIYIYILSLRRRQLNNRKRLQPYQRRLTYTEWSLTACLLAAFIGKASYWCSMGHFLFDILSTIFFPNTILSVLYLHVFFYVNFNNDSFHFNS